MQIRSSGEVEVPLHGFWVMGEHRSDCSETNKETKPSTATAQGDNDSDDDEDSHDFLLLSVTLDYIEDQRY